MRRALLIAALACLAGPAARAAPAAWDIRAVVLTTYEAGADRGDAPGELQPWVEGEHLTETVAFPLGVHDLYTDRDHHLLVVLTGTTTGPAAATVMALGTDPRFDLRRAYWLVDGISGFDPQAAPLGSVVWADWVVGAIMRGVDPREAPRDWPYGAFMEGATRPNRYRPPDASSGVVHNLAWKLDPALVAWAAGLTRHLPLDDTPNLRARRRLWTTQPATQAPPEVLVGGDYAADTFWHGRRDTQFARDWVRLLTQGQSRFVTSNMEDAGIMESLWRLSHAGRADLHRVLVLRSNANFTEQHEGQSAVASLNAPDEADAEAFDNGYRVGAMVIHTLLADWPRYGDGIH